MSISKISYGSVVVGMVAEVILIDLSTPSPRPWIRHYTLKGEELWETADSWVRRIDCFP